MWLYVCMTEEIAQFSAFFWVCVGGTLGEGARVAEWERVSWEKQPFCEHACTDFAMLWWCAMYISELRERCSRMRGEKYLLIWKNILNSYRRRYLLPSTRSSKATPWWRIFHEMIENHRLWLLIFFHNRIRLVFVDGENGFPLSTLSFSVDWSVWAKSIKMLLQFIKSILSTLIRPPVGTCRSKPTIICWVLIDNLLEINHREPFCMRINQTLRLHDGWQTTNSSNNPSKIRAHLPEK